MSALGWTLAGLGAAWLGFAFVAYPLLVASLARWWPRPLRPRAEVPWPRLAVVIAVHNAEAEIARKLEETLALDYPRRFEVIVASDASEDATERIVGLFKDRGVRLLRSPERRGKEAAQALAVAATQAEVIVFTDVGARLAPDALREVVRPFADPEVAAVTSEDWIEPIAGEGSYVRGEMRLRRLESRAGCLVGLSGSFFAVRRELCSGWRGDLASDFRLALEAARRGLRAVSEPRARARIPVVEDSRVEWRRKVRTVRRGLAVLSAYRGLLHPRHGRVALALWGHKVARFTAPAALAVVFVGSLVGAAAGDPVLGGLALMQAGGCALAALVLARPALARWPALRLAAYGLLVNAAIARAWVHHLRREPAVVWEPTRRRSA